jgi:hypothetical protein
MKRLIQLVQFPEIGALPVMNCVFAELAGAFADNGCQIRTVKKMDDLEDGGILFLDDAAGNYKQQRAL